MSNIHELLIRMKDILERLRGECISPYERAEALRLLEQARKELDRE